MLDIPTAITDAEAQVLREHAQGRVLEVGSLLGYSTVVMAQEGAWVYSVDPHEGYPTSDPKPTLRPFLENLWRHGVRDRVHVHIGDDRAIFPELGCCFDFAFIDATGCYRDTLRIMRRAWRLLKRGATLAVHDYDLDAWPGAGQAVREFASDHGVTFNITDTLATIPKL